MKTIQRFTSIENFETERLTAKRMTELDFDKLCEMHNNHKVMATLGGLRSNEKTWENLNWNLDQWRDNGFGLWMFYIKDTDTWVGRGGLRRIIIDGQEEIEVAYALMPDFWQQGFATEIAKACTEVAFEVLRLNNIICYTSVQNQPSQKVMQKVGFKYERDLTITYDEQKIDHVIYRMKNYRKVELVPYNPDWIKIFAAEKAHLTAKLGAHLIRLHHIGSTAIPNMIAKPVIDMLLECKDIHEIESIKNLLMPAGYRYFTRQVIPYRSYITRKVEDEITFHLHIYESDDVEAMRHIYFRDYLIEHPEDASAYANTKSTLATLYPKDINSYVKGKDQIVKSIDRKAKITHRNKIPTSKQFHQLSELTEEQLLKAFVANMNIQMTHFAQYLPDVELIRIPGYTIVNSGLDDDTFNYVLDASFADAEANKRIKEVSDYFISRQLPFVWWLSPFDQPANLGCHLEEMNYRPTEQNIAMVLDLREWELENSTNSRHTNQLKIIRATTEETLLDFARVLTKNSAAFLEYYARLAAVLTDDDPIEFYVGYIDNVPIVRGATCYYGHIAGFYGLSTLPEEQGKGFASQMHQFRLSRAKERGYNIAALAASEEGQALAKKLGFREIGVFKEYKLPAL